MTDRDRDRAKISEHFRRYELVVSDEHPELAYTFLTLPRSLLVNSMRVTLLSMQPFRNVAGRIDVLSFCRGEELNAAVGGVDDSDHLEGLACDFKPREISAPKFLELARDGALERAGATWDKLNLYVGPGTFHVSQRLVEAGPPRMLIFVDWQTVT